MSFSLWKWPAMMREPLAKVRMPREALKLVGEVGEEALAEVVEVFEVGFADFAQEEAFEAGEALAIVGAHLGEEPVGFAAAAGAAVADGGGAVGVIAEAGGGAGGELAGLEEDAGADEVLDLVDGTTRSPGVADELGGVERGIHRVGFGVGGSARLPGNGAFGESAPPD